MLVSWWRRERAWWRRLSVVASLAGLLAAVLAPDAAQATGGPTVSGGKFEFLGGPGTWASFIGIFGDSDPTATLAAITFESLSGAAYTYPSVIFEAGSTTSTTICAPVIGGEVPELHCNVPPGLVHPGDPFGVSFSSQPAIGQDQGGFVFVVDSNGLGAGESVSGPGPGSCPSIGVSPSSLSAAQLGSLYSLQLSTTPIGAPFTFSTSPTGVPPGLALSSSGVLSGVPTASGRFAFTVTVGNAQSCSASQTYKLTVPSPPMLMGSVHGLSHRHPSFRLTAIHGTNAPPISILKVDLPFGLSLACPAKHVKKKACKGSSVTGGKPTSMKVTKDKLVVKFNKPVSRVSVTAISPLLRESSSLQRKAKDGKIKNLKFATFVTDADGRTTPSVLNLK